MGKIVRIPAIDGLRVFLFLAVFLFHTNSGWLPVGWGGSADIPCHHLLPSDGQVP